jgi:hypothetical protein
MEPRNDQGEKNDDSGTSATPRIVNGMPYHPPKKISLRKGLGIAGLAAAPEFLLLLAIIPLAVVRVLKYCDSKGWLPRQPDLSESARWMVGDMDQLIECLERAAAGRDVHIDAVKDLRFDWKDGELGKAALESWRRLVHFATDADIRSKDPDYDDRMRQEMAWRASELKALRASDVSPRAPG